MSLDTNYFNKKLSLVLRDLRQYTSEELARELFRLAATANPIIQSARINELGQQLEAVERKLKERDEEHDSLVNMQSIRIEQLERKMAEQQTPLSVGDILSMDIRGTNDEALRFARAVEAAHYYGAEELNKLLSEAEQRGYDKCQLEMSQMEPVALMKWNDKFGIYNTMTAEEYRKCESDASEQKNSQYKMMLQQVVSGLSNADKLIRRPLPPEVKP